MTLLLLEPAPVQFASSKCDRCGQKPPDGTAVLVIYGELHWACPICLADNSSSLPPFTATLTRMEPPHGGA